ncbi:MAG TPA: hypothetical protein PK815_05150 [Verrucomicrobiota bacterium]|nr:hypothetical protein [Verrucomicrobiota bacterium]
MGIPCTPLVHGLKAGYIHGIWMVDADAWKGRNEEREREDYY